MSYKGKSEIATKKTYGSDIYNTRDDQGTSPIPPPEEAYLLQEDGFLLLQEDGFSILIS